MHVASPPFSDLGFENGLNRLYFVCTLLYISFFVCTPLTFLPLPGVPLYLAGSTYVPKCERGVRDWCISERMPHIRKKWLVWRLSRQHSSGIRWLPWIQCSFLKRQSIHPHQYDCARIFLWCTDSKRIVFGCSPNVCYLNKYCSLHLGYTSTSIFHFRMPRLFSRCIHVQMLTQFLPDYVVEEW